MKAFQKLSCTIAIVALFSCTKTIVEEQKPELIKPPEAVMTLPGHSEISSGYIYLDPVDGHYKSALFDFGPQLTHISSGYVTGQAGVGISSISAREAGLIAAEIEGDKFTAYMPAFPYSALPTGPSYSVKPAVIGYEIDTLNLPPCCTLISYNFFYKAAEKYYVLDSIKAKAKGLKLKTPLSTTVIDGSLFSPNTDGIIIFKGRILMNTNSPSGMAIYPYDVTPVYDPADATVVNFGTYYPASGTLGSVNAISFLSTQSHAFRGYGDIIGLIVNFQGTPAVYTGTFRSEPPTGSYQMARIFVTFHGTLPDGTEVHLDDVEVTPGV